MIKETNVLDPSWIMHEQNSSSLKKKSKLSWGIQFFSIILIIIGFIWYSLSRIQHGEIERKK